MQTYPKNHQYHKNMPQEEAEVFRYHWLTLLKQKLGKNICILG